MTPEFYIKGNRVREPLEWKSLEVELNFEDLTEVQTTISASEFTWTHENSDLLNAELNSGTAGGLGVFWGVPLKIKVGQLVLFDGYIDLREAEFSCEKVKAKIREKKNLDWLDLVADGFGFDLLYRNGLITQSDFVKVPYVISSIPDYSDSLLFATTAFMLTRELVTAINELQTVISMAGGVLPILAALIKAILVTAYIVFLVLALLKMISDFVATMIQPVRYHLGMLVKTHFEKACAHLALTFSSSIFDLTKNSFSELTPGEWANLCIIPEKYRQGNKKVFPPDNQSAVIGSYNQLFEKVAEIEGNPPTLFPAVNIFGNTVTVNDTIQKGYFNGTFGDFIRAMSAVFHAKFFITGNVFHFERSDFGNSNVVYQIPNVRRRFSKINADELVSNYLLQFQVDSTDENTIKRYRGTNVKAFTQSNFTDTDGTELISGFKQPLIQFALGKRKDSLTAIEKAMAEFLPLITAAVFAMYWFLTSSYITVLIPIVTTWNSIVKPLNTVLGTDIPEASFTALIGFPPFPNWKIQGSRIGMLSIENHLFNVPKLVLIDGSGDDIRIPPNNQSKLSAINLYNKFHFLQSFVPRPSGSTTNPNVPNTAQAFVYEIPTIPFCIEDYYKVRGLSNQNQGEARILSPEGNIAKILSLKWNIWNDKAYIKYKQFKRYTHNLKETLIENLGI